MDEFSFLSVFFSIILGFAVTEVLAGYRSLLQARGHVRLYWPSLLWSFVILVICAQSWWAMFDLRTLRNWNFAGFAIVLFQMILLYMFAGLVFPHISPGETIDLRANYFSQRRWFCGLALLTVLTSLAKDLVLSGRWTDSTNLSFHLVFAALALIGGLTRKEWFHKTLAVLIAAIFALYVGLLFTQLH